MSIEVTGNYRPGRPRRAILVSVGLLVLMIIAAAALSRSRNRPINLGSVQQVPWVQGLRMAWPAEWEAGPLDGGTPAVAVAAEPTEGETPPRLLFLLVQPTGNESLSPVQAADVLFRSSALQLGLRPRQNLAGARSTLAGMPAFGARYTVNFRARQWVGYIRATGTGEGTAVGLLLLVPVDRDSPADERLLDRVGESMQIGRQTSATVSASVL